jgi:LacI family transcriptional regulator
MRNKIGAKRLADVAKAAGVSLATAYRAISSPEQVAGQTRERVLQAMAARKVILPPKTQLQSSLRANLRTGRVGFLVPEFPPHMPEFITNDMCQGIQQVLDGRGIELLIHHYSWKSAGAADLPQMLHEKSVDGILVRPCPDWKRVAQLCSHGPALTLGESVPGLDCPSVLGDDHEGTVALVRYLAEFGHRRIAYVSGLPADDIYSRRLEAFRWAMKAGGLPLDEELIFVHDDWLGTYEADAQRTRQFLDAWWRRQSRPTAIMAANDAYAVSLLHVLIERNVRVPDEVSVTGFGDGPHAALAVPPLTTARLDHRAMGRIGAALLLQQLEGIRHPMKVLLRTPLVERRSCAQASL